MDSNPMPFVKIIIGLTIGLALLAYFKLPHLQGEEKQVAQTEEVRNSKPANRQAASASMSLASIKKALEYRAPLPGLTVYYTDRGFSPEHFEIKAGESINFVNQSSHAMQITFEVMESTYQGGAITQPSSEGSGKIWTITINDNGKYIFFNRNNREYTGTVVVR